MAAGKTQNKQPSKLSRWKDAVAYDARAKATNWLRFLKRDTAVVSIEEMALLDLRDFKFKLKGRVSAGKVRIKAVGVQAVVQAIRMKEDTKKVVDALHNNDWVSVSRLVQPLGLPIDYTRSSRKQQKKVLVNV